MIYRYFIKDNTDGDDAIAISYTQKYCTLVEYWPHIQIAGENDTWGVKMYIHDFPIEFINVRFVIRDITTKLFIGMKHKSTPAYVSSKWSQFVKFGCSRGLSIYHYSRPEDGGFHFQNAEGKDTMSYAFTLPIKQHAMSTHALILFLAMELNGSSKTASRTLLRKFCTSFFQTWLPGGTKVYIVVDEDLPADRTSNTGLTRGNEANQVMTLIVVDGFSDRVSLSTMKGLADISEPIKEIWTQVTDVVDHTSSITIVDFIAIMLLMKESPLWCIRQVIWQVAEVMEESICRKPLSDPDKYHRAHVAGTRWDTTLQERLTLTENLKHDKVVFAVDDIQDGQPRHSIWAQERIRFTPAIWVNKFLMKYYLQTRQHFEGADRMSIVFDASRVGKRETLFVSAIRLDDAYRTACWAPAQARMQCIVMHKMNYTTSDSVSHIVYQGLDCVRMTVYLHDHTYLSGIVMDSEADPGTGSDQKLNK